VTGSSNNYIEGANTATGTVENNIDFTTATFVDGNVTTLIGGWTLTSGQGLVLTSPSLGAGTLNPSAVLCRNVQSNGQVYTVNAKVNNPTNNNFYVTPRFITGYSGSDLKVIFESDGIHIPKFPLKYGFFDNGDDYFYPFQNALSTLSGGSIITTQLTEVISSQISNTPDYTATLLVQKDGTTLFSTAVRSVLPGDNINDQLRHGGAGADVTGFTVMGFPNTPMLNNGSVIISGSSGAGLNPLAAIGGFMSLVATIFGLTNTAAFPAWLWVIFTGAPIATLTYMNLELIRGD
jgi:hypothetical protein